MTSLPGNTTGDAQDDFRAYVQREAQKYLIYQIGWYIHLIWLPIIVPVGMIGNILSFLVMIRKENRRISCCLYMAALAVSDSVALFRKGYEWLIYMFRKPYILIECQFLAYFGLGSIQYGMFLILGMTVDRVLAIKFPLKSQIYCTPKRAKWTIFSLLVVSVFFNIPHFITSRHIGNGYTCTTFTLPLPYLDVYAWSSTVINFFIPFIALLVMNTLIIKTIRNRARNLTKSQGSLDLDVRDNRTATKSSSEAERQLAFMLSLVGIFFVILNVPQCIRLNMFLFVDRWQSPYNHAIYIFVFHFSNKLYYTNNGINFFLYCVGGSKFRQSLRDVFCSGCREAEAGREGSSSDSTAISHI